MPRLFVDGPYEFTDLRVLDAQLRVVAAGTGSLAVPDLQPGIYRVEARVPGAVDERLFTVPDVGDTRIADFTLPLDSPAPVIGARTYHNFHAGPAVSASQLVHVPFGGDQHIGRLFVTVRSDGSSRSVPPGLLVLTGEAEPIARLDEEGETDLATGFSAISIELPAGTYMLAHEHARMGLRGQAIFVEEGWQTQVFVPWDDDGIGLPRALVSMVRLGRGFDPQNSVYEHVEAAIDGLARGRVVLTRTEENEILNAKFRDPILGLLGAYGYILRGQIDAGRLSIIAQNLLHLIPHSADAQALAHIAGLTTGDHIDPEEPRWHEFSSPPMFSLGTEWLIERATTDANLIPASSWLAQIALTRTSGSVWTRWNRDLDPGQRIREIFSTAYMRDADTVHIARAAGVPLSIIEAGMQPTGSVTYLASWKKRPTKPETVQERRDADADTPGSAERYAAIAAARLEDSPQRSIVLMRALEEWLAEDWIVSHPLEWTRNLEGLREVLSRLEDLLVRTSATDTRQAYELREAWSNVMHISQDVMREMDYLKHQYPLASARELRESSEHARISRVHLREALVHLRTTLTAIMGSERSSSRPGRQSPTSEPPGR